jgi:hypothetical protein
MILRYRFGAGVAEENPLGRGHQLTNLLRHLDFQLMLRPVQLRDLQLGAHRGYDRGMCVSQDQRTPGQGVINVGVAVDIGKAAAVGGGEKQWQRSGRRPHPAAYSTR